MLLELPASESFFVEKAFESQREAARRPGDVGRRGDAALRRGDGLLADAVLHVGEPRRGGDERRRGQVRDVPRPRGPARRRSLVCGRRHKKLVLQRELTVGLPRGVERPGGRRGRSLSIRRRRRRKVRHRRHQDPPDGAPDLLLAPPRSGLRHALALADLPLRLRPVVALGPARRVEDGVICRIRVRLRRGVRVRRRSEPGGLLPAAGEAFRGSHPGARRPLGRRGGGRAVLLDVRRRQPPRGGPRGGPEWRRRAERNCREVVRRLRPRLGSARRPRDLRAHREIDRRVLPRTRLRRPQRQLPAPRALGGVPVPPERDLYRRRPERRRVGPRPRLPLRDELGLRNHPPRGRVLLAAPPGDFHRHHLRRHLEPDRPRHRLHQRRRSSRRRRRPCDDDDESAT
mmetsp:Transcript_5217/g.17096  ORF Transcript_5217/g.17096 Transcript_5217/m.17096 type:complete len:401 (-) Transcript_5217:261-1463(-)